MNFRPRQKEEPEINLIPFIDVLLVILILYRDTPVIKSSSPLFCFSIVVGIILGYLSVYASIGLPTTDSCNASLWLLNLAFIIVFSFLLTKTYRIYRIFDANLYKKGSIPLRTLLISVGILIGIAAVILTAAAVTSTDDDGFRFFGREHASTVTGTPWGEIFANSWRGRNNDRMSALTDATRREQDAGRADPTKHGWTILRMLQGTPLRQHEVRPPWWVEIDDATDDLDFPDDYRRHPATRGLTPGGTACA